MILNGRFYNFYVTVYGAHDDDRGTIQETYQTRYLYSWVYPSPPVTYLPKAARILQKSTLNTPLSLKKLSHFKNAQILIKS